MALVADGDEGSGEFVLAQIKHGGVWNTDPGGPANLLKVLATRTNIRVTLRKRSVELGKDSLEGIGMLYASGVDTFRFSERERAALRAFLARGVTVLFDASLGMTPFMRAAQSEMRKVLPGLEPEPLRMDHPLFSAFEKIRAVQVTPALVRRFGNTIPPAFQGMNIEGRTAVIFSPFDLGGGWQGDDHPQARGYRTADALRLGMNLVTYAMTH